MWIVYPVLIVYSLIRLKDLCNANACWLVLIYNTLVITNVAKRLFKYVPYIYYNFSVNFLQSTWIRPQKNLPNQDSWGDITTCQSPSSKHYHYKRQGYVGQPVLSALSQWHDTIYTCKRKVVKVECYCDKALIALTIWHSNIYWNDNVYWMVIDKWCQLKNLGLEDSIVGVSKYSEEN